MSNKDFLELRNALDMLKSRFGAQVVIVNGGMKEINDKILECYGEERLIKGKTMLCGVEIMNLTSEKP